MENKLKKAELDGNGNLVLDGKCIPAVPLGSREISLERWDESIKTGYGFSGDLGSLTDLLIQKEASINQPEEGADIYAVKSKTDSGKYTLEYFRVM